MANREEVEILRENIRAEMRLRGLSQVQLAEKAGLKQPSVSRFLNGDSDILVGTGARIAEALGLPLSALLMARREISEKVSG